MKESRLGEWGNNVTRLLYYLTDIDNKFIDMYEYKAPITKIRALLEKAGFILYTERSTSIDEFFIAYIAGWEVPDVDKLIPLITNVISKSQLTTICA
jgi:hypothetical protein